MRVILLIAACAALLAGCDRQASPQSQGEPVAEAAQPGAPGLDRSQAGTKLPAITVKDPDGEDVALADIAAGKPLLVNLWATWCAPCIKELPTLAALADKPAAPTVLALSQDTQVQGAVAAFLDGKKIALEPYQDSEMAMSSALGAQILPTTVLYGADGKEIWRYTGDLDWTGPEAARLLADAR